MKYRVSRMLAGPMLHLLWRPEVTGGERIPATGGAILASNHLSLVNSIFLPLVLARPVTFAAKSEYFTGKRPRPADRGRVHAGDRPVVRRPRRCPSQRRRPWKPRSACCRRESVRHLSGGHPVTRTARLYRSGRGSAGWRWPRACRSFRWPWSAPTRCWRPGTPSVPAPGRHPGGRAAHVRGLPGPPAGGAGTQGITDEVAIATVAKRGNTIEETLIMHKLARLSPRSGSTSSTTSWTRSSPGPCRRGRTHPRARSRAACASCQPNCPKIRHPNRLTPGSDWPSWWPTGISGSGPGPWPSRPAG